MLLIAFAGPALADSYAEIYVGRVKTQKQDVVEEISNGGTTISHKFLDVETKDATEVGVRFGNWLSGTPWLGFGADLFHYRPKMDAQRPLIVVDTGTFPSSFREMKLSMTGLALDVRARLRLGGGFEPYIGAGPVLFYTVVRDTTHFRPSDQSDSDWSVGLKYGVGLLWRWDAKTGVLLDFRETRHKTRTHFTDDNVPGTTIEMKNEWRSRHALIGLSRSF
jgi:opacity protein-like surface antigen